MSFPRLPHVAALITVALVAGACQGAGDSSSDAEAGPSIGQRVEAALADREGELSRSYVVFVEDMSDGFADAVRLLERRGSALDAALGSLPADAPREVSPDVGAQYAAMIEALEEWRAATGQALDELEARQASIEPLIEDWIEAGTGGPPAEFVELLRGDESEATAFGDACTTLTATLERTAACYLVPPAEAVTTSFDVEIGSLVLAFEVEGVGVSEEIDGGVIIGTPRSDLMVAAPQPVANPEESLHRENGEPIPGSLPWPDDLEAWYSQLPVEVLGEGEETLSNGSTWSYVVLVGTDAFGPFALVDAGDCCSWATALGRDGDAMELVLWETTIDGQQVIAVSSGRPDFAWEDHLEEARLVLDTIRVVEG